MYKRFLKIGGGLLCLVAVTWVAKTLLLQGLPLVKLAPAPELAATVSRSLGTPGSSVALPVFGEDYTLKDVHYFNDKEWAVATVEPVGRTADTVFVIMHKINGIYQVVLGPGNVFSNSYLYSLPAGVSQYLSEQGVMNG